MGSRVKDLTGQIFGRWSVISFGGMDTRYNSNSALWLCRCECGVEKLVSSNSLSRGKSKSCGCLLSDSARERALTWNKNRKGKLRLPYGDAEFNKVYRYYVANAKKRGYSFELTKEQFKVLTQQDCYCCGAKPSLVSKTTAALGEYVYNGIDRIDNSKGYTLDNTAPCCAICNTAKLDRDLKEYVSWIFKSADYMKRTGLAKE